MMRRLIALTMLFFLLPFFLSVNAGEISRVLAVGANSRTVYSYEIRADGTWINSAVFCTLKSGEPIVRRCQLVNGVVYVMAAQTGTNTTDEFGKVIRFSPSGTRLDQDACFTFNYHADGLAVTPDGRYVFVVVSEGSDPSYGGKILRYDTTTGVLEDNFVELGRFTRQACCDGAGNLYVSERVGGNVYKFRVDHVAGEYCATNYEARTASGLDLGGAVCYSAAEDCVYQGGRSSIRKLAAGDLSEIVSAKTTESGCDWFFASACIDGVVYFCSFQCEAVYAVDPTTCATRSVLKMKLFDLCAYRRTLPGTGLAVYATGWPELVTRSPSEVLVARERICVERWRVEDGAWNYVGEFMSRAKTGLYPISVAAANNRVYVATVIDSSSGTLQEYLADGTFVRTVNSALPKKPDQICVAPDGTNLYFTTIDGYVYRVDLATGATEQVGDGLSRSRMLAFGVDGYLYVTATKNAAIHVFDTSVTPLNEIGALTVFSPGGGFVFAGSKLEKIVVPGLKFETIDLIAGTTQPYPETCYLQNGFSAIMAGGRVYAGDFTTGNVVEVPLAPGPLTTVVTGKVSNVSSMVNLTEALDAACQRSRQAIAKAHSQFGTSFIYDDPIMPREYDLWRMLCDNPADVDLSCGIWPSMRNAVGGIAIGSDSVPRSLVRFYPQVGLTNFLAGIDTTLADVPKDRAPIDTPYNYPSVGAHFRTAKGFERHMVDMTGDGVKDCVAIYSDWTEYGVAGPACPLAYDENGRWTNNQIQAFAYLHPRDGAGSDGKWLDPVPIRSDGKLDLQGGPYGIGGAAFADFDGDGDIDMITGDFRSEIWYFENIGTPQSPEFAKGRHPTSTIGGVIEGDLCMMSLQGYDWDGDGLLDLLASEEDGRASWWRNTGSFRDGTPLFDSQQFFRAPADELKFGCLATPWCVDWDGDGDWDIIAGNSGGHIAFIENLSGSGVEYPRWAAPKLFTVADPENANVDKWLKGNLIRAWCGDENSPQGPAEAKWGYTVVSVADWDGDGFLDIMANDVKGSVVWFRNPGQVGTTVMSAPRAVEVEWEGGVQPLTAWEWRGPAGKALRAMWRTTPCMYDCNGDGLVDLLMSDAEGYLALYERAIDGQGNRYLKHPRRALIDDKGNPIRLSSAVNGGSGRRKFCFADWNGDGEADLIINSTNALVYENLGTEEGVTRFQCTGAQQLTRKALAGHTCCPSACDFNNDGAVDLVIGAEDGYFYYYRNPKSNP